MAKAPVAGAIKTRLAHQAGVSAATRFARHCTAALIARVAFDPRWQTTIWATPDAWIGSRHWPRGIARAAQGGGDLGHRMQRMFASLPRGPVVIVGTDIPGITAAHIEAAFALLGRNDVVFGPAADGGYWLVGARRRPRVPQPFAGVRWSSEHALADTLANLAGCSVGFVATLADVDDAAAFAQSAANLGRRVPWTYLQRERMPRSK